MINVGDVLEVNDGSKIKVILSRPNGMFVAKVIWASPSHPHSINTHWSYTSKGLFIFREQDKSYYMHVNFNSYTQTDYGLEPE